MEKVVEKLDSINQTLEKILGVMKEPKNKLTRSLELIVLFAGALGILNAADIIRLWLTGGK